MSRDKKLRHEVNVRRLLQEHQQYKLASSSESALQRHANSISSQNGEDGMISEALARIGVTSPVFVEFGASDGLENCTRHQLENGGSGLWIEGDPSKAAAAEKLFSHLPVDISETFIDIKNVIQTIKSSELTRKNFDLLVMDLDGNDWWLLREILGQYHPVLIVAEYNSYQGAKKKWIMPYNSDHRWANDTNYGASLTSYNHLMKSFGYELVACEPCGVNAFWVSRENSHLFGTNFSSRFHFAPAAVLSLHASRDKYCSNSILQATELSKILINTITTGKRSTVTDSVVLLMEIVNHSSFEISSFGDYPIRIGFRTRDQRTSEPTRGVIDSTIPPNCSGIAYLIVDLLDLEESEVAIVQEGVGWSQWTPIGIVKP
jgi:hypothetical protein